MTRLDAVRDRNDAFATSGGHREATIMPRLSLMVLTCLDPRVDPAAFLGVGLGEAAVMRNAGGRVTPAVLADLAFLADLAAGAVQEGPLFEVAVIHHNQCGTAALADRQIAERVADATGGDAEALAASAVLDSVATVREDVERLRSAPAIPGRVSVSGHVYDVTTGRLTTVAGAVPARAA